MRRALAVLAMTTVLTAASGGASAEAATQEGRSLVASLSGRAEGGHPRDADGVGRARIPVNPAQQQVCYRLDVSKIDGAAQAHIHRGRAGENGATVVSLKAPQRGRANGCVGVSRGVARDLLRQA